MGRVKENCINTIQSEFVTGLLALSEPKKLISLIYKKISTADPSMPIPVSKWEHDLTITTNADFWSKICTDFIKIRAANLNLIELKVIHRSHYTTKRLHKMDFPQSDRRQFCQKNDIDKYLQAIWL